MKRTMWILVIGGFLAAAAVLEAKERRSDPSRGRDGTRPDIQLASLTEYDTPPPAPGIGGSVPPGPISANAQPMPMSSGMPLYDCVKYHDRHNIAPCAVPMVVAVKDPCAKKDACGCCAPPKCVMVKICVPNCGCPKVCCKHDGARVRYDYGKYAVNITSKHGVVVVDYDD